MLEAIVLEHGVESLLMAQHSRHENGRRCVLLHAACPQEVQQRHEQLWSKVHEDRAMLIPQQRVVPASTEGAREHGVFHHAERPPLHGDRLLAANVQLQNVVHGGGGGHPLLLPLQGLALRLRLGARLLGRLQGALGRGLPGLERGPPPLELRLQGLPRPPDLRLQPPAQHRGAALAQQGPELLVEDGVEVLGGHLPLLLPPRSLGAVGSHSGGKEAAKGWRLRPGRSSST
mmetsp:Transcript_115442/g.337620  ORF Transcript_115442/g.337620 Transcript_115442/m.337620 type:complete len:231 (-) Transcript_115442:2-694(-)